MPNIQSSERFSANQSTNYQLKIKHYPKIHNKLKGDKEMINRNSFKSNKKAHIKCIIIKNNQKKAIYLVVSL